MKRLEDHRADMLRAISRISSSHSASLVRLFVLEHLSSLFGARGAAWVLTKANRPYVAASLPTPSNPEKILWNFPEGGVRRPTVLRGKQSSRRRVLIPAKDLGQGTVLLWGIEGPVSSHRLTDGLLLVHHGELSLLNLSKLDEMKQQTFIDDLTGLYNSRYLKSALTKVMARGRSFSVLFIDVDHFKAVNDRHGHLVGSEFLVAIGRTIKNAVRHVDSVFRYGGDEFVVILQDTPLVEAREIAERIRRRVGGRTFSLDQHKVQTTVSIGLAAYPEMASDVDSLLQLADHAMYSAKKGSRNAVHLAGLLPMSVETKPLPK